MPPPPHARMREEKRKAEFCVLFYTFVYISIQDVKYALVGTIVPKAAMRQLACGPTDNALVNFLFSAMVRGAVDCKLLSNSSTAKDAPASIGGGGLGCVMGKGGMR